MEPDAPPRRGVRILLLVGLVLVLAWPALQPHGADGFPISTYPMFSTDRGRLVSVTTAVGRTGGREEVRLGPAALGGGDQVMLAVSTAQRAVDGGPASARRYCEEVAARVHDPEVVEVVVQTEERDSIADVHARDLPRASRIHAECKVPDR